MNLTINISQYPNELEVSVHQCKEWCAQQHYNASYMGFIVLLFFNIIMTGVFLLLFKYNDKVVHNTKITDEQLSVILNSIVKFVFLVNTIYGIYWILFR